MINIAKTCAALMLAGGMAAGGVIASAAQERTWHHGLSLMDEVKYPADFAHFDYVNPDAPKGGRLRMAGVGSFDSLNPFIVRGQPAGLLTVLTYDALMKTSLDEVGAEYGLIAEAVSYPDDYSSVTFKLREEARWHDGEPITADDVIFSLETLKRELPQFGYYYQNVERMEKEGDKQVTFHFDSTGNRELPQILGQLLVLPKHYWEGTDASGRQRNISQTTLEVPLGSGPYRVKRVDTGKSIVYERVADYWGKDLPVNVGYDNIGEIELIYFRDRTIVFEAFKGDNLDVRTGAGTVEWETQYDNFPAYSKGLVIKGSFETKNAQPMQAFVFNLRRKKFADIRVRQAFNLAYDFETQNRTISHGDHNKRTDSFFAGSELAATGVPEGRELELLEPYRDQLPAQLFTEPYKNPVGGTPQNARANLREATRLLREAGWSVQNGVLTHGETGERMEVEFLLADPGSENVVLLYQQSLERLGIKVNIRTVDSSQFQNRVNAFDFDIMTDVFQQSLSPGNEQRQYWGSAAANRPGSQNTPGIVNPVIDALIEKIIFATSRDELVAASRALDRVLLWNTYMIPQFHRPPTWIAYWDRYGHPDPTPDYSVGFPYIWWWDEEKAARVRALK